MAPSVRVEREAGRMDEDSNVRHALAGREVVCVVDVRLLVPVKDYDANLSQGITQGRRGRQAKHVNKLAYGGCGCACASMSMPHV